MRRQSYTTAVLIIKFAVEEKLKLGRASGVVDPDDDANSAKGGTPVSGFGRLLSHRLDFRCFLQFCQCRNLSRSFFQVTPQTISNWLYRRKRPSLDKYLALVEFSTQNAVMEMPPRVRKLLNELEAYAKRNRVKQKDLAKDIGVEPQRLSDWLRGHRTPNAERILKIQEYLRAKNP